MGRGSCDVGNFAWVVGKFTWVVGPFYRKFCVSNLGWVKFLAWVREWHILRGLPFLRVSYSSITAFIIHSKLATLCITSRY